MSGLKSLKKYSWLVSGLVMVIIGVGGLTVSDFQWLPVEYQKYVVMIIGICGVFVKIFVENARVTRAENIIIDDFTQEALSNTDIEDCIDEYTEGELNSEYQHRDDLK